MSNYLPKSTDTTGQVTGAAPRHRKLWIATGVVGLTGVVSLAAVGAATGAGAAGVGRVAGNLKWSTTEQFVKDDGPDRDDHNRDDDWNKGDHDEGQVREVRCDDDALVEAFVRLNNEEGGT
ncbi:hypothetical protein ACGFIZ_34305, partial [Micromonospora sp. NPDC048830]